MENSTVINMVDYRQNKEEEKCTALVPYASTVSEDQTTDNQTEVKVSDTTNEDTVAETVFEVTLDTDTEAEAEANTEAETETKTAEKTSEDENKTEEKAEKKTKKAPIFIQDDFAEINKQKLSEEDKAKLYMINHFHIQPELLNSMLNGDFSSAWQSITDMNKVNLSVKKKLEKELKGADDSRLQIVQFLIDKATKEPEFADKVLLEHKSFDRCFKYIIDKVKALYVGKNTQCIQADEDWTYQQAVDYYELDDYDKVMEERRKAEAAKKKAEEARKKAAEKKKTTKTTSKTGKAESSTESKDEDKTEEKKDVESKDPVDTVLETAPVMAEPTVSEADNVTTDVQNEVKAEPVVSEESTDNSILNDTVSIDTIFEDKTANEPEYKMTTNEFGQLSFLF